MIVVFWVTLSVFYKAANLMKACQEDVLESPLRIMGMGIYI